MKLELKNVHFSERLSQETNAFAADIHFDGKKVGYAENDGHGGPTNVQPFSDTRDAFQKACEYAKSLPEIQTEFTNGGKKFTIKSDLETQVDDLFSQWLDKKEIQKESNKGVFFEKPNGVRATAYWKGYTIAKLKKHPKGMEIIRTKVLELQSKGNTILNTNLPEILC